MSTLETNAIGKYSGNNVSVDDALNLKSYTTTQRDALTSVAGDMIYNTTDSKVQVYNGSAWEDLGSNPLEISYVLIAGGGGGAGTYYNLVKGGGGGAGGYVGDSTANVQKVLIATSTNYTVTIGAGGAGGGPASSGPTSGAKGSDSQFKNLTAKGGGGGAEQSGPNIDGGSGAGGGDSAAGGTAVANQGNNGGT